MEISFSLFPTEECDVYIHKFYQVLFLDREDSRIDAWTAVVASVTWPDPNEPPPEFKAILSVRERTGGWRPEGPEEGIPDPSAGDVWGAIRKIWGAQSQYLIGGEPITISNIVNKGKEWLGSSNAMDEYIMFGVRHGFAAAKDGNSYNASKAGSILGRELKKALKEGALFGILVDETGKSFLPLAFGTYTDKFGDGMRRLNLPKGDTTVIPAFWWMRHTVPLPKRALGLGRRKQFDYEVILAKEGGPGSDGIAEYRSYLVAPQFYELEQNSQIIIEAGSLRPPEAGPRTLRPSAEFGGGDFNSLDRQQKTHDAYLAPWTEDKKIERREYYKLNLPGSVRDHRTPFNRVALGVRLKSSLAEIRLYVIGLVITLLLGIGIDGDRLSEIVAPDVAAEWPVFYTVASGLIQWIIVSILVLFLYLIDLFARHGTGPGPPVLAGEQKWFERDRTLGSFARWSRGLATCFYLLWAIGAFCFDHDGRAYLAHIVHEMPLIGNVPDALEAPRIFGVLAIVMGVFSLFVMLTLQPKIVKDIARFIFERN